MATSDSEKRPVRVTILGQSFSVLTKDSPVEVERLAQELDELRSSIAAKAPNADSTRVAVMAAFHLADRLRTVERELADLKHRVDEKSVAFAELLTRVLDSETQ